MARELNKVYLRQLMAEVAVTWIKHSKATGLNRVSLRRHLEDTLNIFASYILTIDPKYIQARSWKQAYKIAAQWVERRQLSRRQMATLISISLEKSIR